MKTIIERKKEYKDAIRKLCDLYDERIEENSRRVNAWKSHPPLRKAVKRLEALETRDRKLRLAIRVMRQSLKHHRMEYTKSHPQDKVLSTKITAARNRADKLKSRIGYFDLPATTICEQAAHIGCSYYKSKRHTKK
jgi:chromosome segregation ATPase